MLWYRFGDTLPTPVPRGTPIAAGAADSSGNNNPGLVGLNPVNSSNIVLNSIVTQSFRLPGGTFNTAGNVGGPSSAVTVVRPTAGVTVEAWVYTEAPTASNPGALLVTGNNLANEAYSLYIDSSFKFRCAVDVATTGFVETEAPSALSASTIYHVACVYNGANLLLYINGSQVASSVAVGAIQYVGSFGTTVGGPTANDGLSKNFQGVMAQVAIYATPLPATRILAHFNEGVGAAHPTPTPAPTATPTGTFMGLPIYQDYSTSFTPYAASGQPNSVWNTPISATPQVWPSSAAIVAVQFPSSRGGKSVIGFRANEAGVYDVYHPRFLAQNSDPVVSFNCTLFCGAPDNGGLPATMHIPALARPAEGGDHHMDVTQPDGTEISMWLVSAPSGNWGTAGNTVVSAGVIANCGNLATGIGWLLTGPAPTAAGYCDNAGMITAAELVAGSIKHALFTVNTCAWKTQYPIESSAGSAGTNECNNGAAGGPPLGAREQLTVSPAAINAVTTCTSSAGEDVTCLWPWEKGVLIALHDYGAYNGDDGGCANGIEGQNAVDICIRIESEEPWLDFNGPGYTSPFAALAAQGWVGQTPPSPAVGTRWVGNGGNAWNPLGVAGIGSTWGASMRYLNPLLRTTDLLI